MEIIKTILYWIWKIISYIFISIWSIVAFIFGWIWNYIKLDSNTPKTLSGNRDRRFKSTRELERLDSKSGCVIFIILMLVFGISKMCSNKKDKYDNSDHADTTVVEKKSEKKIKHQPDIRQNEVKDTQEINNVASFGEMPSVNSEETQLDDIEVESEPASTEQNSTKDNSPKLEHLEWSEKTVEISVP